MKQFIGIVICSMMVLFASTLIAQNVYFQQDDSDQGIVSMEAENYHDNYNGAGNEDLWSFGDEFPAYSGDGYMIIPNNTVPGGGHQPMYMKYFVNFVKTDTHYIWIRCRYQDDGTPAGGNDSYYLYFDGDSLGDGNTWAGTQAGYNWEETVLQDKWSWGGNTFGYSPERARFNVDTVGLHYVELRMREDGLAIDKVVLTCDSDYVPGDSTLFQSELHDEDTGPEESVQVSIDRMSDNRPNSFALGQNYPNPFNPTTEIEYSVMEAADVQLTIYNVLGEEVTELVNTHQIPGSYKVTWDGTNASGVKMTSGLYLYKLQANGHVQVRKMLMQQ